MDVVDRKDAIGLDHMHNVRVVPDGLRGNLARADFHAQYAAEAGDVIRHAIQANERPLVIGELIVDIRSTCRAAGVLDVDGLHRIGVDADDAAVVVVERVVDDDGPRAPDEHHRRVVPRAEVSGAAIRSVRIEFKERVRQTQIGLMDFNGREVRVVTGNRHAATAECDVGLIDVDAAPLPEEQSAPISSGCGDCAVAGRIERAARPAVAIVFQRGEDHLQ